MFENSLVSRLSLRCPEHPKNLIKYICTDTRCETWPLFCEQCRGTYRYKQKHYGHQLNVMDFEKGIEEICGKLAKDKDSVAQIYRQMISVKGVEGLLKWQEQKQQHFTAIEKHINTIKFQIEEQLSNIVKQFQNELQQEKVRLYMELQKYQSSYRQKFDKFSKLTQPIVALQNRFKFYASPSAFILKISNQAGTSKLGVWLADLKHTLNLTEKAAIMPTQYSEQIRKYGEAANEMMDQLPRIKNIEYEKQLPLIIGTSVKDILRSFVNLKQTIKLSPFIRSTSVDNIPSDAQKWKNSMSFK